MRSSPGRKRQPRNAPTVTSKAPPVRSETRRARASTSASSGGTLTARVAVNHLWLRHFGQALVDTPQTVAAPAQPPIQAPQAAPSNVITRPPEVATTDPPPAADPPGAEPDATSEPDVAERLTALRMYWRFVGLVWAGILATVLL